MSLIGKLLYQSWFRPVGRLRRVLAAGGPAEARRTGRGREEMAAAAHALPPPTAGADPALEIQLLSGEQFWYQSAFCLWTFAQHAGRVLAPVIYDDGTLAGEFRSALHRLFPLARFVDRDAARERLDRTLPASRFPVLRERWENYPNIRKLIDPHVASTGWRLVIDSDLLFFRRPDFVLEWCDRPDRPLHATDCETSYGYPEETLEELAGGPVPGRVNVGLCGLNSAELDWERIESWCRRLIERHGTHYFLEQALVALLVAGRECACAPVGDYVTRPVPPEAQECRSVMHHYVADSKRWYFQQNWRVAVERAQVPVSEL